MLLSVFLIVMVTMVTGLLVPVPGDEHLLTMKEFKQKIVGKRWLGIYSFYDVPGLSAVSKVLIKWTIDVGGGYVERQLDARQNLECVAMTAKFTYEQAADKAKFHIYSPETNTTMVQDTNRTDRVLSLTPDKYHFHSICLVQESAEGTCDKMINTLMVPGDALEGHQGDLNLTGLPWGEIVQFMETVYGRRFEDDLLPPIQWLWHDKECPE